ncbi:MAG: MarR family transcriptional regulator [Opitutales bacterium]
MEKLTKPDYELLARFRYSLRLFLRFSEQVASSHGLTPQQYQALLAIEGYPGRNRVTVRELAEQLLIAHHSAGGLVDRLEATGLVCRKPCTKDRRQVWVSLTRRGAGTLEKLYRIHRRELAAIGPGLAEMLQVASQEMPDEGAGWSANSPR